MDTKKLYDQTANKWQRRKPNSLSDFTGRPAIFAMCGDVRGKRLADLGCGEGYCSREFAARGASVVGVELSQKMIDLALQQESELQQGIAYQAGDITELTLADASFDMVTAVFVFNYVTYEQMLKAMHHIYRILKPGGSFVFSIPHPSFPFIAEKKPPFFFDFADAGYFSARNQKGEGEIHCLDGTQLNVQMVHKPLEDFFTALKAANFSKMPDIQELRVLEKHLKLNPSFFGPVKDIPLHMGFRVEK